MGMYGQDCTREGPIFLFVKSLTYNTSGNFVIRSGTTTNTGQVDTYIHTYVHAYIHTYIEI